MSGAVSTQFDLMVPHAKLAPCIVWLEAGLSCLKRTPYHRVLGKDFLRQTDDLAAWLIDFHQKAVVAKLKLAAIYLEMNGFTINPKQWHCNLFGYKKAGNIWELDWLTEWDAEREECFVLRGMEPVQKAFAKLFLRQKPRSASGWRRVAERRYGCFMDWLPRIRRLRRYPGLEVAGARNRATGTPSTNGVAEA